jgi:hypothetical protein
MTKNVWSERRPCIAHMHVLGCVAYAMIPDEKRDLSKMQRTPNVVFGLS